MTKPASRYPSPESAIELARRTTLGIGAAVLAVLVVQALVEGLRVGVGASGPMSPFAAGPLVGATVVAGAAAAVVYPGLVRFTDRPVPRRNRHRPRRRHRWDRAQRRGSR